MKKLIPIQLEDIYIDRGIIKAAPLEINEQLIAYYDYEYEGAKEKSFIPITDMILPMFRLAKKHRYDEEVAWYHYKLKRLEERPESIKFWGPAIYPEPIIELVGPEKELYIWRLRFWSYNSKTAFRKCKQCGCYMLSKGGIQFCSNKCQDERNKELHAKHFPRKKYGYKKCIICGDEFVAKRTDAKCCSGRCRTKLSRQK